MKVSEFVIETLGIDSESNFPGVGLAFTRWDAVYVGTGNTRREAAEDSVANMYTSDVEVPDYIDTSIDWVISKLENVNDIPESEEDVSEIHHYAAIYLRFE